MRLSLLGLLLAGLAESRSSSSSSSSAPIYVFDGRCHHVDDGREAPGISPEASRLLFSQQLGVSQYHSLDTVDESIISYLNQHRRQEPLLAHSPNDASNVAELLVLVEGVENAQDILDRKDIYPSYWMTSIPTPSSNEQLARAFSQQLASREGVSDSCIEKFGDRDNYFGHVSIPTQMHTGRCCPALSRRIDDLAQDSRTEAMAKHGPLRDLEEILHNSVSQWCGDGAASVIYLSALERIVKTDGTSSMAYRENLASLSRILIRLQELAETGKQESVIVLFPPSTRNAKRTADPYGDYSLPARAASPQNRAAEAPLSSSDKSPSSAEDPPKSTSRPPAQPIFPACHSTHDACVSATNNCSGHGACTKKYSSHADGDKEAGKDCYTCRCTKTILRSSEDQVKTIHWGGNACQKKDVSMPFFLLAGITILIVVAASWGIGLLFSVGEEPLPGVIGAGVAGPKPK